MKFGVPLRNQILSRGTGPQLKKLIYNSVNVIYKFITRHPILHVELNWVKFPLIIDTNKKILNYLNYLREKEESSIVKQSLKKYRLTFIITVIIVLL